MPFPSPIEDGVYQNNDGFGVSVTSKFELQNTAQDTSEFHLRFKLCYAFLRNAIYRIAQGQKEETLDSQKQFLIGITGEGRELIMSAEQNYRALHLSFTLQNTPQMLQSLYVCLYFSLLKKKKSNCGNIGSYVLK